MRTGGGVAELREGDFVTIVGEVADAEWGTGVARTQAIVLGCADTDWYIGELEDGSQVEFHADQVEDVQYGQSDPGYAMGGFFDWFKKKPSQPRQELIPIEPSGEVIYVSPTGVARYEERPPVKQKRGFLKHVKEAFKFLTQEGGEASSIFDVFKTRRDIALRPQMTPAVSEKPESLFSVFMPPEKSLAPIREKLQSFIPTEGFKALAPYVEAAQEIFQDIKPSAELEPYEEKKARRAELWKGMFEEVKEEPLSRMFEAFGPSEVAAEGFVPLPPEMAEELRTRDIYVPVIPLPPRETILPSVEDVARGLLTWYDPIGNLWNSVRKDREDDSFQEALANCLDMGEPAGIIIESLAGNVEARTGDESMALAALLQIPWDYVESKMVIEKFGEYDEVTNWDELHEEIFYPAIGILTKAFDLIKPDDLPGEFAVYIHSDWDHTALMYLECVGEETQAFGEGRGEAFETDEGDEEVEEAAKRAPVKKAKKKAAKRSTKKKAKR